MTTTIKQQRSPDRERPFWLAFSFLKISPKRFGQIIDFFGSAEKAWQASDQDWKELTHWNSEVLAGFLARKKKICPQVFLDGLVKNYQPLIWPITKLDSYYPANLLVIEDAPPVLYARGRIVDTLVKGNSTLWDSFWSSQILAVVGTRRPTAYGCQVVRRLVEALGQNGLIIVSGLAKGIDALAHQSALEVGGKTVAVLGSGVDVAYPIRNKHLYQEILLKGVVFSELPPGTNPLPAHFPARNRIIAGLSMAVLVIEGSIKSGSLITASLAADQGREVLAVPGDITSQSSSGTNYLIKNGAGVVTEVADVLAELGLSHQGKSPALDLDGDEKLVTDLLSGHNFTVDEISFRLKIEINRVNIALTKLEIKGVATNLGLGEWGLK